MSRNAPIKIQVFLVSALFTCALYAQQAPSVSDAKAELLYKKIEQEANGKGLTQTQQFQDQLESARRQIVLRAWEQNFLASQKFSDSQRRTIYTKLLEDLGNKEYQLRHLQVRDEMTAKLLLEKIQAGSTLASLAAEYSIDSSSNQREGLAPWMNKLSLTPEIRKIVDSLPLGRVYSKPIQTSGGWHVLQLESTRNFTAPAYKDLIPELDASLARTALQEKLKSMSN